MWFCEVLCEWSEYYCLYIECVSCGMCCEYFVFNVWVDVDFEFYCEVWRLDYVWWRVVVFRVEGFI